MHATARMRNAGRGTRRRTRNHLCLAARIRLQVGGGTDRAVTPSRTLWSGGPSCILLSIPNTGSGMNHRPPTRTFWNFNFFLTCDQHFSFFKAN